VLAASSRSVWVGDHEVSYCLGQLVPRDLLGVDLQPGKEQLVHRLSHARPALVVEGLGDLLCASANGCGAAVILRWIEEARAELAAEAP
jgi:hypothetical protein